MADSDPQSLVEKEETKPPVPLFDATLDLATLDGLAEYNARALKAAAAGKLSGATASGISSLLRVHLEILVKKRPKEEDPEKPALVHGEKGAMEIIQEGTPPVRSWPLK